MMLLPAVAADPPPPGLDLDPAGRGAGRGPGHDAGAGHDRRGEQRDAQSDLRGDHRRPHRAAAGARRGPPPGGGGQPGAPRSRWPSEGHWLESEVAFRRAIELASGDDAGPDGLRVRAEALEGLGSALLVRPATPGRRRRPSARPWPIARRWRRGRPTPITTATWPSARGQLGRALARLGRVAEAIRGASTGPRALGSPGGLGPRRPRPPGPPGQRPERPGLAPGRRIRPRLPGPPGGRPARRAGRPARPRPARPAGTPWAWPATAPGDWAGAVEALERSVGRRPARGDGLRSLLPRHGLPAARRRRAGPGTASAGPSTGPTATGRATPTWPDSATRRSPSWGGRGRPRWTPSRSFRGK